MPPPMANRMHSVGSRGVPRAPLEPTAAARHPAHTAQEHSSAGRGVLCSCAARRATMLRITSPRDGSCLGGRAPAGPGTPRVSTRPRTPPWPGVERAKAGACTGRYCYQRAWARIPQRMRRRYELSSSSSDGSAHTSAMRRQYKDIDSSADINLLYVYI